MAVPLPTREVAGIRVPKRGEYQPSMGSTTARWMVQESRSGSRSLPCLRSCPTCQESVAHVSSSSTAMSGPKCHDSRNGTAAVTSMASTRVSLPPG